MRILIQRVLEASVSVNEVLVSEARLAPSFATPVAASSNDWLDIEEPVRRPLASSNSTDSKGQVDSDAFALALRLIGVADGLLTLVRDVDDRLRVLLSGTTEALTAALTNAREWKASLDRVEDEFNVHTGSPRATASTATAADSELEGDAVADAKHLPLVAVGVPLLEQPCKVEALRKAIRDGMQGEWVCGWWTPHSEVGRSRLLMLAVVVRLRRSRVVGEPVCKLPGAGHRCTPGCV